MRQSTIEDRQAMRSLLRGMLVVPVMHCLALPVVHLLFLGLAMLVRDLTQPHTEKFYWLMSLLSLTGLAIGITQIFYLFPLGLYLKRKGKDLFVKGMIISAVITALINGACFATLPLNASAYGLYSLGGAFVAAIVAILGTIVVLLFNLK